MEELTRLREALGDGYGELVGAVERAVEELRGEAGRTAELEAQLAEARAVAEGAAAIEAQLAEARAMAEGAAAIEAQLAEARAGAGDLAALQSRIEALDASSQAAEGRIADLTQQMAGAAEKYRALLLANHPEIPARLVQGTTIAEIEGSLAAATATVEEIRRQLLAEQAAIVPNGAGGRSPVDLAALSPIEKIKRGLAENGR
ncbi:MAG: hypothetical protein HY331_15835 [Chloroflexi bacterium]|nr:hypothetical protein [Chloroflexota bacterium]